MGESEGAGTTEDDDTGGNGQSDTTGHGILRDWVGCVGPARQTSAPLHRYSPPGDPPDMSAPTQLGLSKPTVRGAGRLHGRCADPHSTSRACRAYSLVVGQARGSG